jgi:hypothetical protein
MPETNNTMLEKTFADLAYASLRDKASGLLDYLLGFQMIKSEEEGKRAIGLFGFEIDEKVYYCPVFFLNGEIRGLESVYSVDSDLFLPLTEEWVNSLINKQQVSVGQPETRSQGELGVRVPNYARLRILPSSHGGVNLKVASAAVEGMKAFRNDDVEDLPSLLKSAKIANAFRADLDRNVKLRDAVEVFYNYADFVDADKEIVKVAADAKPKVVIITSITDENAKDLSDKQREQLISGGVAAIDKRPEVSKSILYTTETKQVLENPARGGMYDVLFADGSVQACLVMLGTDQKSSVFVYRLDDKNFCKIEPQVVHVVRQYSDVEYAKELEKVGHKPSECKPGDIVIFANADGVATGAVSLREKMNGLDDTTVFTASKAWIGCSGAPVALNFPGKDWPYYEHFGYIKNPAGSRQTRLDPVDRIETVVVGGINPKPVFLRGKLVVNDKHHVAITLSHFKMVERGEYTAEEKDNTYGKELASADFGDYNTIRSELRKTAEEIQVWKNDHLITLRDGDKTHAMHKAACYNYLMKAKGLSEEDAAIIIDNARPHIDSYFVKKAMQFVDYPDEGMDESYGNEMSAFHKSQVPLQLTNKVTPEDNRDFYTYNSPFGGGGHEGNGLGEEESSPLSKVTKAMQTGQKDVFDASVLGSLIKSSDPGEIVDRFLPTVIAGMDRLGRILFLAYWHYPEFEKRYGKNDLAEFLDNLKSTFSNLGDLVTFAKKRSLSGDPDHYGLGIQSQVEE